MDGLKNYFNRERKNLNIPYQVLEDIQTILTDIPKSLKNQLAAKGLKKMRRDTFNHLKTDSDEKKKESDRVLDIERVIEKKYGMIKELENDFQDLQCKIEILEEYENYLIQHRQPGWQGNIASIEYYSNKKRNNTDILKSILHDKLKLFSHVQEIANNIHELYIEIQNEEIWLAELNRSTRNTGNKSRTNIGNFDYFHLDINFVIPELTEEDFSSRSYQQIKNNDLNHEISFSDYSQIRELKNNYTKKKIKIKKPLPLVCKKSKNKDNDSFEELAKVKKFSRLSRNNLERLAIIEGKTQYGYISRRKVTQVSDRPEKLKFSCSGQKISHSRTSARLS